MYTSKPGSLAHEVPPCRHLVQSVGCGLGGVPASSPVPEGLSAHPEDFRELHVVAGMGGTGVSCRHAGEVLKHGVLGARQLLALVNPLDQVREILVEKLAGDFGRENGFHRARGGGVNVIARVDSRLAG